MAFLPVGLIRSPITRTRSMGTVRAPLHTAAGTDRGTSRKGWEASASFRQAIYSGVVPQHPPSSLTPCSASTARSAANSRGPMS